MAGEKSKSSGEFGEKIVTNFYKLIGWNSVEENITIDCVNDLHNRKSYTHGIDGYYGYKSELLKSHTQEDILISVKHTTNKYPPGPTSKFKSYLKDLAEGMQCFPMDENYVNRKISGIQERKTSGVIFWISKLEDDNRDITKDIWNFNNTDKIDFGPIYLVDNNKLNFLLKSINYAIHNFDDYNFEYHFTGFNHTNPAESKSYGKILPVQLITTNILPIRVKKENQEFLSIFINEEFNEDSLKKAMGFAKMLANSWPAKTFILYSDYNHLDYSNVVERVKTIFNDNEFTNTVEVRSFKDDIASLGRD
jgi:hypothetical protein